MNLTSLLVFTVTYLAAVILPGPGVTALVARVLARGTGGIPSYVAGSAAGSVVWFSVAALGLAAIAAAFAPLFLAIRYAGAAYLLYLAWKLWTAPVPRLEDGEKLPEGRDRLFLTGLSIGLGNPKAVVFFLALLPTVIDLRGLTLMGFLLLAAVIVAVVTSVYTAYTLTASRVRPLFASARAGRLVNRGSAVAMAGAAAAVATR